MLTFSDAVGNAGQKRQLIGNTVPPVLAAVLGRTMRVHFHALKNEHKERRI